MLLNNVFIVTLFLSTMYYSCKGNDTIETKNVQTVALPDTIIIEQKMEFQHRIDSIEKKIIDLTTAQDLYTVGEFIEVYEYPEYYIDSVLKFLEISNKTIQQKMIAIYSIQKLSENMYISFAQKATKLYQMKIINEDLIALIISSDLPPNYTIIKNYNNYDVIELLNTIKDDGTTSLNMKNRIEKILSGVAWEKVQENLR